MKRASYREAVAWIADNDESAEMDLFEIERSTTVQLVADLFGKEAVDVAKRVLLWRVADNQGRKH